MTVSVQYVRIEEKEDSTQRDSEISKLRTLSSFFRGSESKKD